MTAEIAILNKNAVALAADSAVTLRNPENQKVYNTANKLFMLSKYHPVGIMVYGSADLMGIPWETAIKMFRAELHTTNFDRLIQFAEHFIAFLESNRLLFPASAQEAEFVGMCQWVLSQVHQKIDSRVKAEITSNQGIDDLGIERIIAEVTAEEFQTWQQYRRLDCFTPDFEGELLNSYSERLGQLFTDVFGHLPINHVRDQLLQICAFRATKDWWSLKSGGIVVAGFGKNDFLPVVHSYTVESMINNRVKYDRIVGLSNDMGESHAAMILPFAQAEIVYRFIRGIDPDYKRELKSLLRNLLTSEYPERIVADFAERTTDGERRAAQAEIIRIGRAIIESFDDQWSEWEQRKFVGPVIDIVGDLPKDDLAAMAESLVNLTSFKRRITAEAETVGGPIDVAVISKGDGFVWIKRKHYFQKDLNPAFFANYYRREDDGL
jgi:hypothetical protein